jgi:hypothetical protein
VVKFWQQFARFAPYLKICRKDASRALMSADNSGTKLPEPETGINN